MTDSKEPALTAKGEVRTFVKHSCRDRSQEDEDVPLSKKDEVLLKQYDEDRIGGPFPLKLHIILKILKAECKDDVMSWMPHGRAFCIHKSGGFEEVMKRFFKQSQMSSFRRQLNLYGFLRLTSGRNVGAYYHELFLRGKPLLSMKMVRTRIKGTKIRASSSPADEPKFYSMPFMGPCVRPTSSLALTLKDRDTSLLDTEMENAGSVDRPAPVPARMSYQDMRLSRPLTSSNLMEQQQRMTSSSSMFPSNTASAHNLQVGNMITSDCRNYPNNSIQTGFNNLNVPIEDPMRSMSQRRQLYGEPNYVRSQNMNLLNEMNVGLLNDLYGIGRQPNRFPSHISNEPAVAMMQRQQQWINPRVVNYNTPPVFSNGRMTTNRFPQHGSMQTTSLSSTPTLTSPISTPAQNTTTMETQDMMIDRSTDKAQRKEIQSREINLRSSQPTEPMSLERRDNSEMPPPTFPRDTNAQNNSATVNSSSSLSTSTSKVPTNRKKKIPSYGAKVQRRGGFSSGRSASSTNHFNMGSSSRNENAPSISLGSIISDEEAASTMISLSQEIQLNNIIDDYQVENGRWDQISNL